MSLPIFKGTHSCTPCKLVNLGGRVRGWKRYECPTCKRRWTCADPQPKILYCWGHPNRGEAWKTYLKEKTP